MKFYITNNNMPLNIDSKYYLIAETGEYIDDHVSSNKYFAMYDLYTNNIKNKERCKEISKNSNVQILYMGDDDMTDQKLLELNNRFYYIAKIKHDIFIK